jgi:hypothetical protein
MKTKGRIPVGRVIRYGFPIWRHFMHLSTFWIQMKAYLYRCASYVKPPDEGILRCYPLRHLYWLLFCDLTYVSINVSALYIALSGCIDDLGKKPKRFFVHAIENEIQLLSSVHAHSFI